MRGSASHCYPGTWLCVNKDGFNSYLKKINENYKKYMAM
jgi:hypothetical protein